MIPSRERLRQAITAEWETSTTIAERAHVNPRAAGTVLATLAIRFPVEIKQRPNEQTGRWEYRRSAT